MPKKVANKKKVVSAGGAGKTSTASNPLFKKAARNFRIGGDIQPKRNLTRFVKWPKYVRIQRQKRVLFMRLKSPPALNQFSQTVDKNQASQLLKLLAKYAPETTKDKKTRLQAEAEARKGGKKEDFVGPKPILLKYGLNHITTLVEENKAKMVVIAHDVDPLEMMIFLPALCRKKGIPYCFVKGKARLGKLVHTKTATCVALTEVRKEDFQDFDTLKKNFTAQFNENTNHKKQWGGGLMGIKNQHMMAKREKAREIELAKKANM
jgi:large subunit ribosomal protein L7Ae